MVGSRVATSTHVMESGLRLRSLLQVSRLSLGSSTSAGTRLLQATPSDGEQEVLQVLNRELRLTSSERFLCRSDDLRMTLSTFSALAQGDPAIIKANSLPTPAIWRFVQEPCWACEAGLKGISPTGKPDDCHGPDSFGIMRNGRKTGKSVRKGHAAAVHCASVVDPGHKFDEKLFVEAEVEKVSKEKGLAIEAVHEMITQFDGHGH